MIKISVIIPVYKVLSEKNWPYFVNLLNSIFKNIEKSDKSKFEICEIIIVNDEPGVTINKKVLEINHKYSDLITIIDNEVNVGQAKSRNIGFQKSNGNVLHFIDQDDYIDDLFYDKMVQYFLSNKVDLVVANIMLVRNGIIKKFYKKFFIQIINNNDNLWYLRFFLIGNYIYSPGQYLIFTKTFKKLGGFPELINKGTDDYGLLLNLTTNKCKYKFISNSFFYYNLHSNQNKGKLDMDASLRELFKQYEPTFYVKILKIFKFNKLFNFFKVFIFRLFFFKSTKF